MNPATQRAGAVVLFPSADQARSEMQRVYDTQRAAYMRTPYPDFGERKASLTQLMQLVERNRTLLADALSDDFGHRSATETQMVDVNASLNTIRHLRRHLRRWMRPERRGTSIWFLPGGNKVHRQPLGVVGVMSPWNYPVHLSLGPAATALAAGNRVMVKMSEAVPQTTALLKRLVGENFEADQLAIVDGDASVAEAFSGLRFDHLLFTGSTEVGRRVMTAAARNLTPVTLELGGKSPAIVDPDYPLARAAQRIAWGKLVNGGQTCVAPDYVMVPKGSERAFAEAAIAAAARLYPEMARNPDATSIVNDAQHARLLDLHEDAVANGAEILQAPASETMQAARQMPLTVVLGAPADARVMREEIFGPILPVLGYGSLDDAVATVSAGEAPLALYHFTRSHDRKAKVLTQTRSGGVTINDTLLHYLQDSLPFGGVGHSGIGSYHGREGFDTFSHKRAVFTQRGFGSFTGTKLLYPPYGRMASLLLKTMRLI